MAVFDERRPTEVQSTVPPELDESISQMMQDELLFEQYGGHVAAEVDELEGGGDASGSDEEGEKKHLHSDSFDVPCFVAARAHLQVVDTWAQRMEFTAQSKAAEFEYHVLQRDGVLLTKAFQRRAERDGNNRIGAKIAAEELTIRLKHLPEV